MLIKHNKHIMHDKATIITVVCFAILFIKPNAVTYFHIFQPKIRKTNCTHFALTKILFHLPFESLIEKKSNQNSAK